MKPWDCGDFSMAAMIKYIFASVKHVYILRHVAYVSGTKDFRRS
jgi:hypothetical protein